MQLKYEEVNKIETWSVTPKKEEMSTPYLILKSVRNWPQKLAV